MAIHVMKLAVGADCVEDLAAWQQGQIEDARAAGARPLPVCGTRSFPKRVDEILNQGSLFWIIKGQIVVRQRILDVGPVLDEFGERCGFWLDPALMRVEPTPKRAFQGWRYLDPADAPKDVCAVGAQTALPEALQRQLVALGAW